MIAGLVLAAGRGTRFGGPHKLLADVHGVAVVRRAVDALRAAGLDQVAVVTDGDEAGGRVADALAAAGVTVVPCAGTDGSGTSIACGVRALAGAEAVVVLPGDQPFVPPAAIAAVIAAWREGGALIVASRWVSAGSSVAAPPTLFARELFGDLAALRGDGGAREVVARHAAQVRWVTHDLPLPRDVDTAPDLDAARKFPG